MPSSYICPHCGTKTVFVVCPVVKVLTLKFVMSLLSILLLENLSTISEFPGTFLTVAAVLTSTTIRIVSSPVV
jgi:uncharacterized metal-binding protein